MDESDFAAKVGVNVLSELFKATLQGFQGTHEWVKTKKEERDIFGLAAKRYAEKLEELYNSVHIFGMDHPVPLRNIYTQVNILEKITARHRATAEEPDKLFDRDSRFYRYVIDYGVTPEELDKLFDRDSRSFGNIIKTKEGVQAINGLHKSVILGKPGAGKTTFLKYLALQALDGNLEQDVIPIFVGMKEWSDSGESLVDYIVDVFDVCDFPNATPFVLRMLSQGRALVLLDGFDEVSSKNIDEVVKEVRRLAAKYSKNKFVLSCRLAAYSHFFENFTEVEIADFATWQIEAFVNNWFGKGTPKATACLQALSDNSQIRELASVPLLVTLLCLAFDETMAFPANRAELYKEALDALLKKWDASRSITRGEIYRHLSLRRKESLFSRIAAQTFERNQYFFPERDLEVQIRTYIRNLPESGPETLDVDSEIVLKSIIAQHGIFVERAKGIYSFSHLTFQEYFTARYVVENQSSGTVRKLVDEHLINGTNDDARWREIFLLTANMLDSADEFLLLMSQRVQGYGRLRLSNILSGVENTIKRYAPHSDTASRSLVLYFLLDDYLRKSSSDHSAGHLSATESCRIAKDIARLDHEIRADWDEERESPKLRTIWNRSFSASEALDLVPHMGGETLFQLGYYLRATSWILECLKGECYISKTLREDLYDELLAIT